MRGFLGLILILLAVVSPVVADTTWVAAGNISGSWTAAHSPYMIGGDVTVPTSATLQIAPGVTVYFRGPYRLSIDGALQALGTATDTIRFTTDTLANPGRWRGIEMAVPDGVSRFDYCILEHAAVNGAVTAFDVPLTFTHCLLRHNRTDTQGGAINYISFATRLTLADCVLEDNHALDPGVTSGAGAIFVMNEGLSDTVFITRCLFRKNQTTGLGGAIWAMDGSVAITQCRFEDNHATVAGGGIYAMCPLSLRECLLHGNNAADGGGITYFMQGGIRLDHCVLDSNRATHGAAIAGGGNPADPQFVFNSIFSRSVGPAFDNDGLLPRHCLFAGNTAGDFGPLVANDSLGVIRAVNANGDSTDVFRNLFTDPLFVNPATGDYHLTALSPCIDAGDSTSPPDADGTPADIGAFPFFQPLPLSPRYVIFDVCGVNYWADTAWVSLRNLTAEPVRILDLATTQSSFSGYIAPTDSVVAAGDSVAVRVICAPDTCGEIVGDLTIHTDQGDARCRLNGYGYGSYLATAPALVNFGGVPLGLQETLQITLRNTGVALMHVTAITVGAPYVLDNVPTTIPVNQTRTVDVRCLPTVAGTFRDTLRIQCSAYNTAIPIALLAVGAVTPDPPTVFDLLAPANDDTLACWWDSVTFRWSASHDPYGAEPPQYALTFQYNEWQIGFGAMDTSLTVDLSDLPGPLFERDTLFWWVVAVGNPGATESSARFRLFTADTGEAVTPQPLPYLPTEAALLPAYPNPFNATSTLTFDVAHTGPVTLTLYNLLGEEVATLVDDRMQPGRYRATWNAAQFSSGTYLAVLQTGRQRFVQKLLLLK